MKWEKKSLWAISKSIQTGPFGSQLHQYDYSLTGIPVVMPKDLVNGHISEEGIARVGENHVNRLSKHKIEEGDILYSRRGDVGRCALATVREKGWLCGTGCLRVTIDKALAHPMFVYYQLQRAESVGWVEKHAVGSTMLNLNTSILSAVPVEIPDMSTQNKIVGILSSYDNLIENNQKQIKLLEEAAQRLYQEWFVKLRFSGHEKVKVVDGVPEGWKKCLMSAVCDTIGGGTPSTKNPEYYTNGTVRWVTPTDITKNNSLILLDSEKRITEEGLEHSSAKMLPPYTILMTSRASVGFFGLCEHPVCTNQGFISCVPYNKNVQFYLLGNLINRVEEIRQKATGSTFLEISKKTFRNMEIIVPDSGVLNQYNAMIHPMINMMEKIAKSIRQLTEARDRLLPKLMNGEIEV